MSELDRAVQAEIDAYQPAEIPPLGGLVARKRRRDRRRAVAVAVSAAAVVVVAALGVPSFGLGSGRGGGSLVAAGPSAVPSTDTSPGTSSPPAVPPAVPSLAVSRPASAPPGARATLSIAPATSSAAGGLCRTDQLKVTFGQSGAAAGTYYRKILFQNQAQTPCTLTGYPGVSFLDRTGRQVGPAAAHDSGTPPQTAVLNPQGYANAAVGVASPANYQTSADPSSSTCQPAAAAYLRIYPPGQRSAVNLPYNTQVCTTKTSPVVTVTKAGPGGTTAVS